MSALSKVGDGNHERRAGVRIENDVRGARGAERSELALDGAEDRVTMIPTRCARRGGRGMRDRNAALFDDRFHRLCLARAKSVQAQDGGRLPARARAVGSRKESPSSTRGRSYLAESARLVEVREGSGPRLARPRREPPSGAGLPILWRQAHHSQQFPRRPVSRSGAAMAPDEKPRRRPDEDLPVRLPKDLVEVQQGARSLMAGARRCAGDASDGLPLLLAARGLVDLQLRQALAPARTALAPDEKRVAQAERRHTRIHTVCLVSLPTRA